MSTLMGRYALRNRELTLSYPQRNHITNDEVKVRTGNAFGPYEDLASAKRRKLKWYGHVTRSSGLAKTILTGNSSRRKTKRQAEETMGRQHQRVD